MNENEPSPATDDTPILRELAESVGLLLDWVGSDDRPQTLSATRQRAMLAGLGWPAEDERQAADSLERWRALVAPQACGDLPPLLIADRGVAYGVPLAGAAGMRFNLHLESGERLEGALDDGGNLPPIDVCGYHQLNLLDAGGEGCATRTLAVAPERCFTLSDIDEGRRAPAWGVAVQLYGLRRDGDGGIGDLETLGALCEALGREGADAVAISPIHALFSTDLERFSPYSPSSRLYFNVWHAAPESVFDAETLALARAPFADAMAAQESQALIDWPACVRLKLAMLERLFVHVQRDETALAWRSRFVAFRRDGGEALERHCRFDVLQAQAGEIDWRRWPAAWRDAGSADVEAFAEHHRDAVTFAAFLQWLMAEGMSRAQTRSRDAGMALGLIADLAVGVDPQGSQAWSFPEELLTEFSVGAPPDAFNAQGQNWGVAAFSPQGLVASGYRGFLAMLRAAFAHAGGLRIDHILGLSRLWLVPRDAPAQEGAYLRYPLDDMLRLVALESWRHRAIVIGEDLGTVEAGLREQLANRGILGMSVMWFERDGDAFLPPSRWREATMATTTTHDLPTIAGWWAGNDLDWRERLALLGPDEDADTLRQARREDRDRLLAVCGLSAEASATPGEPPAVLADALIDAALAMVASTPTPLALLPLEDLLGLEEQPNLPGTWNEHPNWRRRLPLRIDELLASPEWQRRLSLVDRVRRGVKP